ncbi:MAG: DUF1549 domain-containing protein [Gemmataceae bacterium]|nr:DUF1549 domain-containing protein [Gemmataceae bacterium]
MLRIPGDVLRGLPVRSAWSHLMKLPSAVLAALALPAAAPAADVEFVRDVRPILEEHCHGCHGPDKQKSGLRLDVKEAAFRGGDGHGPAVVPGKPADSPLVRSVGGADKDLVMPPKGPRLSAAEVATLTKWVEGGAPWPASADRAKLPDRRDHWAFQPVRPVTVPEVRSPKFEVRNPIDAFVLAKLTEKGLAPAPEADRRTWLRRVTFDLTGLPPTPEEVAAFLADRRPGAYERVVDRLLASPRYGERWAQHWLDVVRYADTHGFEVNTERPNAWPYRDYVIRAFNEDRPYDRFVREQLAGDQLGADPATGFLVTASVLLPGQIGADPPSMRLARQDALDEVVVNTSQTFLGLSLGCARCHDHKFDPLSQKDYTAFQAFFAGVEYDDRPTRGPEADARRAEVAKLRDRQAAIDRRLSALVPLAGSGVKRPPVNARLNTDRFAPVAARRVRFTITATNNLEPCLDELEVFTAAGGNVALASTGVTVTSSGDSVTPDRHELRFVNDGRYGNSRSWMSSEVGRGWVVLEFPKEQTVDRVVWGRDREGQYGDRLATGYRIEVAADDGVWKVVADSSDRTPGVKPPAFSPEGLSPDEAAEGKRLAAERSGLDARVREAEVGLSVFAGTFRKPDVTQLLYRGDPEQPRDEVAPAVPTVLGSLALPKDAPDADRRKALADWVADPKNPLTARVMVNRIWQGHFGTGLVQTPSDFGRSGAAPSHPELLDWLAAEFVSPASGGREPPDTVAHQGAHAPRSPNPWSVKHLHRLIVLSSTYRQSGRVDPAARAKDADARLLWRFPSRRLEGEAVRDAMLFVGGRLNLKAGGPGFDVWNLRGGLTGFQPVESFPEAGRRRMIYAHRVRRERDAVFGALDCPDNGQSAARRRESTTPVQALNLLNSRFAVEEAGAFVERVRKEAGPAVADQVRRAYQLAIGRDPETAEAGDAEAVVKDHGLAPLCRALFNCNEFVYLP